MIWLSPENDQLSSNYEMKTDDDKYSVESTYPDEYNLKISDVENEYEGVYTCYVSAATDETYEVELIVNGKGCSIFLW